MTATAKKKPKLPPFFTGKRGRIVIHDLQVFDNTKPGRGYTGHKGFILCWHQKGCGFGELAIFWNEKTKRYELDSECMSPEWVAQCLAAFFTKLKMIG